MRLVLALAALMVASPAGAAEAVSPLKLPPISASPAIANSARGWWVIVAMGPGFDAGVSEMAQREFAAATRSAVATCGYSTFDEISALFTGFPEQHTFQVFAIGGYSTRAAAESVLEKVRPCEPNAYVKSMSLQRE